MNLAGKSADSAPPPRNSHSRLVQWLLARRSYQQDVAFPAWAQPADNWVLIRQDLAFAELAARIVASRYGLSVTGDVSGHAARGVRVRRMARLFEAGYSLHPESQLGEGLRYALYGRWTTYFRRDTIRSEHVLRTYEPDELQDVPSLVSELAEVVVRRATPLP